VVGTYNTRRVSEKCMRNLSEVRVDLVDVAVDGNIVLKWILE
jgi:hypothetical protein